MLGQSMSLVLPGDVGFKFSGKLQNGVAATDLVLTVTQMLRKHGVVGKFVEFYGDDLSELSLADRATIANISPDCGAMGFFPVDHVTLQYLKFTGRSDESVDMIEAYLRANEMYVDHNEAQQERVYSSYLHLDLADVEPCVSGPKRPHDRVPLKEMKADWHSCLDQNVGFKGFSVPKEEQEKGVNFEFHGQPAELKHGSVVIAAITSCTNTSNATVMLGAGLVAKKACELALEVQQSSVLTDMYKSTYEAITKGNPLWNQLSDPASPRYSWDPNSTYIQEPPFLKNMTMDPHGPHSVKDAYCLLYFGDSITTDHISPGGSIHNDSPASKYLMEHGVDRKDFNSDGSQHGNDEVLARGTFANVRRVNKLMNGVAGPKTIRIPTGEELSVYEAAMRYKAAGQDTIILAGAEYGTGSS